MPSNRYPEDLITPAAYCDFIKVESEMYLKHTLVKSKIICLRVGRSHFTKLKMVLERINREQPKNGYTLPNFEMWGLLNYVDIWHLVATIFYTKVIKSGFSTSEFQNSLERHQGKCPWHISDGVASDLSFIFEILCQHVASDQWEKYVEEREKFLLVSDPYRA
jgi:hypothetical protein